MYYSNDYERQTKYPYNIAEFNIRQLHSHYFLGIHINIKNSELCGKQKDQISNIQQQASLHNTDAFQRVLLLCFEDEDGEVECDTSD